MLTYDADIVEKVIHTHFKDYKYKENMKNSASEWYLLPLEKIIKHVDHWAHVFNDGNIQLENIENELNNALPTTLMIHEKIPEEHTPQETGLIQSTESVLPNNISSSVIVTPAHPILYEFQCTYPNVRFDEILNIIDVLRVYKKLNGKTLEDVSNLKSGDLYKTATEIEIPYNHNIPLPKLKIMIPEKFKQIFGIV